MPRTSGKKGKPTPSRLKPKWTPVCEVNNPDKHPSQANADISLPTGIEGQNGFVNVPAGKRLVIEYVSGRAFIPGGQKALFPLIVSLQRQITGTWHYLESTAIGAFGGQDCFQCGRLVKLYADPGTTGMLRTDRDSPTGTGHSRMTLPGHLVSVP